MKLPYDCLFNSIPHWQQYAIASLALVPVIIILCFVILSVIGFIQDIYIKKLLKERDKLLKEIDK